MAETPTACESDTAALVVSLRSECSPAHAFQFLIPYWIDSSLRYLTCEIKAVRLFLRRCGLVG